MSATNFPEDRIDSPVPQPPPLKKDDGRTPGGARRPDLNPTGFVHPEVVEEYNQEIVEAPQDRQYGAHDGLRKDSVTGHLIGIEQAPYASHPEVGSDYPKWVTPHASHVSLATTEAGGAHETGDFDTENEIANRKAEKSNNLKAENDQLIVPRGSVVSVPGFEHHVRRHDGALMVLVHDEDEEKRAMGEQSQTETAEDDVSAAERYQAERAYDRELAEKHREERDKRISEIIVERRKAALDEEQKELEARRERLDNPNRSTAGNEPPRSAMFESQRNQNHGYTAPQEELEAQRRDVGLEKSTADTHDRSGPGMSGHSEADAKVGPEDWTTRQGPVQVRPDKPYGNQGQS